MKNKPFFIAEISANHAGKFSLAKKLIKCAKDNGADAVKLQTYTPDTMTLNSNNKYFRIKEGLWKNYTLWDLYKKAHTPKEWHSKLFSYAKKIGITIFSTPFDETSVKFLETLNCPIYKIASFEMTDLNLVKCVAKTKKPIIISTGMANIEEISETVKTAKIAGAQDITLLYCVSNYPSKLEDFNLNNIRILKEKFNCKVGFSDHSTDNRVAISAVIAGAIVIEKHIALQGQKIGFDIKFSLKGKEIKKYKEDIKLAYNLMGKKEFRRNKSEENSKVFRRSIFTTSKIKKGEKFTPNNIKVIRPGYGISPKYYNKLLKMISPQDLPKETPLSKDILSKLNIKN